MSSFHEVQFPPDIAYGASGGPEYATTIFSAASGYEQRNAGWSAARGRWDVGSGLKRREQAATLIAFFRARKGRAYGFRFKDWTDYQASGEVLGTGDGATTVFQLIKHYTSGGVIETRVIRKPVAGMVKVYLDGVEQASGWSVDTATGLVTFSSAPAAGVVVTAGFEFDVPVRFDTDRMDLGIETYDLGRWSSIPIIEIRL